MGFTRKADAGGGEFVKFGTVGDSITGIYLGAQDRANSKFGPSKNHMFNTKNGVKVVTAKEGSQIEQLLSGEDNKLVKLTFSGTKDTGKGNPMKLYTLDVDGDYVPTSDELAGADDGDDGDSDDEEELETAAPTAAAKAVPRGAAPSAAKRAQVNAFVNQQAKR
jgi:hypothetical protein